MPQATHVLPQNASTAGIPAATVHMGSSHCPSGAIAATTHCCCSCCWLCNRIILDLLKSQCNPVIFWVVFGQYLGHLESPITPGYMFDFNVNYSYLYLYKI